MSHSRYYDEWNFDIIKKSGSWYTYDNKNIGQGLHNMKKYFIENYDWPGLCSLVQPYTTLRSLSAAGFASRGLTQDICILRSYPLFGGSDGAQELEKGP